MAIMEHCELKFLVLSSGYNCEKFVKKCCDSVSRQTYGNFEAMFIDDGSTDGTYAELRHYGSYIRDSRFDFRSFENNEGAAKRRYEEIHRRQEDDETVILLLGLDDELLPDALETIAAQYAAGKWMTYGNWINQHGKTLPEGFLHFEDQVHTDRAYRRVKYRSTAPNTFKKFLFDHIPADDFKLDGKWIDTTTESEVMFSCLEMCGKDRIGVIEKPIYLYNEALPGGTLNRLGREYKYKVYDRIISRKPRELLIR